MVFYGLCKNITANLGIAFYPEESTDTNKLIKIVDDLLYAYKKQGKNKVFSTMEKNQTSGSNMDNAKNNK
nr:diguanylate cyclase [uncultured Clostridium sp.]